MISENKTHEVLSKNNDNPRVKRIRYTIGMSSVCGGQKIICDVVFGQNVLLYNVQKELVKYEIKKLYFNTILKEGHV